MVVHGSSTRRWSAAAALLSVGALAACGSGSSDNSSSAPTTGGAARSPATTPATEGSASRRLALGADEAGGLSFSRRTLRASAGDVTILLDNPSGNQLPHAVEIEGDGVEEESATIEPGATASVRANLRPGTYTFYCPVDSHRQQGMEGTLTVG
jgi:plastocyanin